MVNLVNFWVDSNRLFSSFLLDLDTFCLKFWLFVFQIVMFRTIFRHILHEILLLQFIFMNFHKFLFRLSDLRSDQFQFYLDLVQLLFTLISNFPFIVLQFNFLYCKRIVTSNLSSFSFNNLKLYTTFSSDFFRSFFDWQIFELIFCQ